MHRIIDHAIDKLVCYPCDVVIPVNGGLHLESVVLTGNVWGTGLGI